MSSVYKRFIPLLYLLCVQNGYAGSNSSFPADLIRAVLPEGQSVDLSYFERGLNLLPGVYSVDVYINQKFFTRSNLKFKESDFALEPVLDRSTLLNWGVRVDNIDSLTGFSDSAPIFPLKKYMKDVVIDFDAPNLKLNIQIPQAYLVADYHSDYDVVSPALWNDGITAGFLNYSLTASHNRSRIYSNNNQNFANLWLDGQFNWGPWRLLTSATYSYSKSEYPGQVIRHEDWDVWNTYLQRDIPKLQSTLRLGEINTNSELFDSFGMRGAYLGSNEQMIPLANKNYIPTLSGFANGYAQVFVKQNGHIVYQTNVAPGPWKIDYLPSLTIDSDLTVVTRESDGTERVEIVPYTAVPLMLREGQFRYDFNVGEYYQRNSENNSKFDPKFVQFGFSYGLPWDVTLLGGLLYSQDYQAIALGSALSLGRLGGLSFDVIQSYLDDESQNLSGTSYRIRYEKSLTSIGTRINLATYRYLSNDYRSFADIHSNSEEEFFDKNMMKQRWQLSFSQTLGDWGQLLASGNYVTYHDSKRANKTYSVTYSKSWNGVTLRLSYSRLYQKEFASWKPEDQFMLNFDFAMSRLLGERLQSLDFLNASYQLSANRSNSDTTRSHNVSIRYNNPNSDWYWQLSQDAGSDQNKKSSAMLGYSGDRLNASASYTRSNEAHTWMSSASGGLLIHAGGITPTTKCYGSIALVEIPDMADVRINQMSHVTTDSNGYAVVPSLRDYSANEIVIEPSSLPEGALLLTNTHQKIYPTDRSIQKVVYPVRLGRHALVYLYQNNGDPLPFGAQVYLEENGLQVNEMTSFIGENGRTYFAGLPEKGTLVAHWNTDDGVQTLKYKYELPPKSKNVNSDYVEIPRLYLNKN